MSSVTTAVAGWSARASSLTMTWRGCCAVTGEQATRLRDELDAKVMEAALEKKRKEDEERAAAAAAAAEEARKKRMAEISDDSGSDYSDSDESSLDEETRAQRELERQAQENDDMADEDDLSRAIRPLWCVRGQDHPLFYTPHRPVS